jgi:hypothetical protein
VFGTTCWGAAVSGGSVAGESSDACGRDEEGGLLEEAGVVPLVVDVAALARPGRAQATSAVNATDSAIEPPTTARVAVPTRLTAASRA